MTSTAPLWFWLALPVLFFVAWSYTAMILKGSLPVVKDKAVVLLIAHPDDEAMFFSPTVLHLTKPKLGNHVKILCLSNGNADGIGAIRQKEIVDSALRLGLRSASDIFVLDDPRFPDSPRAWSPTDISNLLDSFFLKPKSNSSGSGSTSSSSTVTRRKSARPETTIDVLLTFDHHGVSSHPNHISLFHGAKAWVRSLTAGEASGWQSPVTLYSLTSVNIARKYASVWDAPFTLAWNAGGSFVRKSKGSKERPDRMMFVNDVGQWIRAMGTMVQAHKSQMVWFRWGWVGLGRYMIVNDLQKVDAAR